MPGFASKRGVVDFFRQTRMAMEQRLAVPEWLQSLQMWFVLSTVCTLITKMMSDNTYGEILRQVVHLFHPSSSHSAVDGLYLWRCKSLHWPCRWCNWERVYTVGIYCTHLLHDGLYICSNTSNLFFFILTYQLRCRLNLRQRQILKKKEQSFMS